MALDYYFYFETELSIADLVDIITHKRGVRRESRADGIAFQFWGVWFHLMSVDEEYRNEVMEEFGFRPTVYHSVRLDKERTEEDRAVFKRLIAAVLLTLDSDAVLYFEADSVVLRRRRGVSFVEPSWSGSFGDLLPGSAGTMLFEISTPSCYVSLQLSAMRNEDERQLLREYDSRWSIQ